MHRFAVALLTLLIAATAPARAWCEASCFTAAAHTPSTESHCPSHDSPSDSATMSAAFTACPTVDAARPVAAMVAAPPPALAIAAPSVASPNDTRRAPPDTRTRRHLLLVPLRI